MRWFKKERPPDIPDIPEIPEVASEQPIGDIEAAQKIREICASAELIAEKMAALAGRKADNEKAEKERAVERPSAIRQPSSARSKSPGKSPTIRCVTFRSARSSDYASSSTI